MGRDRKDSSSIEEWYARTSEEQNNKNSTANQGHMPHESVDLESAHIIREDSVENIQAAPKSELTESAGDARYAEVFARLKTADMLVQGSRLGEEFADEYRRIKRPLLANAFGISSSISDKPNLLLLTSSIPDEGKTYSAINLALSIAQEKDHSVLLVDCDLAKKGVSKMLGLENSLGLVDALEENHVSLDSVISETDIPGLSILSAGKRNDHGTELFGSRRMLSLIDEMLGRFEDRVIIFDGPPILSTPQAQVLAGLVGQIVFVVQAAKTPQHLVNEALGMLPKDKIIGVMMNKDEQFSQGKGAYYGYYEAGE